MGNLLSFEGLQMIRAITDPLDSVWNLKEQRYRH
jgi:hypothetical protein